MSLLVKLLNEEIAEAKAEHAAVQEKYTTELERLYSEVAALRADLATAQEEIRIREESQIPVVPAGASRYIRTLEAENGALRADRDALAAHIAKPSGGQFWYPHGDFATCPVCQLATEIVSAALAVPSVDATTEAEQHFGVAQSAPCESGNASTGETDERGVRQ